MFYLEVVLLIYRSSLLRMELLKSADRDTYLGGENLDNQKVNHFIVEFKQKPKKHISEIRERAISTHGSYLDQARPLL